MRASILIAGMALALAACGNDQSNNTTNADQSLSAENIVSNDVTAIDAVTASDANMAADVNYLPVVDNSASGSSDSSSRPSRPSGSTNDSATPTPAPKAAPVGNSATPAVTNNAT
jgi:hypothetical protein